MSAITTINTNAAVRSRPSRNDLRDSATRALLVALARAADRHDHVATANFAEALRAVEGTS